MTVAPRPPLADRDLAPADATSQLHAAAAELATILYGAGPTGRALDDFGPIYAAAVELVRDAFAGALNDALHGLPAEDPHAAAHRVWAGLRDMTGAATNFRPLALLLDQAARNRPGPLPQSFAELLGAIARLPDPQAVKALLLSITDQPLAIGRADWLRLTDLLISQIGLDAAWVAEWRAAVAPPIRPPRPEYAARSQPAVAPPAPPAERQRWRLLGEDEIDQLRPPAWLIKSVIPAREVTVIAGPGDAGKTFIMVDIVKRVAQHYPVIYVAAEDGPGIRIRRRAWEIHHRTQRNGNLFLLNEPLPLADSEAVDSFITTAHPLAPRLIVIDTLSQSIAGVDENSSMGMSLVLANAQRIAHETGAAVVLIHHYTKDGGTYRGSSVLKNNTYGFLEVERDSDDLIRLECNRIKNAAPFASKFFRLVQVETDVSDEEGQPIVSCVIAPASKVLRTGNQLSKAELRILELVQAATEADGGISTTILQAEIGLKGRGFYSPLGHLRKHGLIAKDGDKRTAPLVITESGLAQLARQSTHPDHQSPGESPVDDATFEVNARLGLLPLLPGSNAGTCEVVATSEATPAGDRSAAGAPRPTSSTVSAVATTAPSHQEGESRTPSSYFPVATTASGSNSSNSLVATSPSRSLGSGRGGSNGGDTRKETEHEARPWTCEQPAFDELQTHATTPLEDPDTSHVQIALSNEAWQRVCDAWSAGDIESVDQIARAHWIRSADLIAAVKRALRGGTS